MNKANQPQRKLLELRNVSKFFGSVVALSEVSMHVSSGEVLALLGDNGAGKSTLIKTLSGVHKPDKGSYWIEDQQVELSSPREALDRGIATVYQDLSTIPLMSITRNFFMGREPIKKIGGILPVFDLEKAAKVSREEMHRIGIDIRDSEQAVGTLSGGERQCLAISRAVYFGAKVLILDEPTSALGVRQASLVLRYIIQARASGIGVVFISHNVHHAYPVADRFVLLNRGKSIGTYLKSKISHTEIEKMMAGGKELENLNEQLTQYKGSPHTV